MTGVYTAHQALSAVAVNAEYAAPYLGRICNMSSKEEGMVSAWRQAGATVSRKLSRHYDARCRPTCAAFANTATQRAPTG